MITKSEWQDWRQNKVTQKLIELLNVGKITAVEDLISMRGEVGDFPRGYGTACEEIIEYVITGRDIYKEEI
jgi:hypothetical protein